VADRNQESQVNRQSETRGDAIEPGLNEAAHENDGEPQATLNPPDPPRERSRKSAKKNPLDSPEDEAIAQFLASPKSLREFKSVRELAAHFNISRMTVYRRSKDPRILARAEWLLKHHKRAGDRSHN
jgi:hypothetical protein